MTLDSTLVVQGINRASFGGGYMVLVGRCVLKLGDHINTDLIYPGQYLKISDPREMAKHALEGIVDGFWKSARPGDILVAGENLGCGSSRTQSVESLRAAGIQAIVASSFARSFYRNSINHGLAALRSDAAAEIRQGDELRIDLDRLTIDTPRGQFSFDPHPQLLSDIISLGGLVQLGKEVLAGRYRM